PEDGRSKARGHPARCSALSRFLACGISVQTVQHGLSALRRPAEPALEGGGEVGPGTPAATGRDGERARHELGATSRESVLLAGRRPGAWTAGLPDADLARERRRLWCPPAPAATLPGGQP